MAFKIWEADERSALVNHLIGGNHLKPVPELKHDKKPSVPEAPWCSALDGNDSQNNEMQRFYDLLHIHRSSVGRIQILIGMEWNLL